MRALTKEEKIEAAGREAYRIQCRDDVCSRSTMAGLASVFDFIPEELVSASASLCGGTGSASGSCGAYCVGLLAVGLKYNASIARELASPDEDIFSKTTAAKMTEYRDRFLAKYGTILCPEIHKQLFGRSFQLDDDAQHAEFFAVENHVEKCAGVVETAARLAAEMILEEEE